jgi:hypothetical protein
MPIASAIGAYLVLHSRQSRHLVVLQLNRGGNGRSCGLGRSSSTGGFSRNTITPHLGGVQLGKLSTSMIRDWRAALLAAGVSPSMTAKAYRLLRAVLMTAVEEDKILPRNPCRVRGGRH